MCFRSCQIVWQHVVTFSCSKHSTISLSPLPLLMRWYIHSQVYIDSWGHRRTDSIVNLFCVPACSAHLRAPSPRGNSRFSMDGERSCRFSGAFSPIKFGRAYSPPFGCCILLPYTIHYLPMYQAYEKKIGSWIVWDCVAHKGFHHYYVYMVCIFTPLYSSMKSTKVQTLGT